MAAHAPKKAAQRKAGGPKQHVSMADRIRLGEEGAAIKAGTAPKDWKQIVKTAHARGWTVQAALSNVPDPLKARTQDSLHGQATSMANEAYAPQGKEFDYQQTQADNLRAKRLADENSFNNWAAIQTSKSAQAAQQAQQNYQNFIDQQSGAAKKAADALFAQAQQQAQHGALGDVSQSASLQAVQDRQAAQAQQQANAQTAAHANEPKVAEFTAGLQAAENQAHQMQVAGVEGDYNKQLATISAGRLKMNSDRAAAIIDNYSSLLNKEIDKANANRDYTLSEDTLSQKTAAQKLQHQEFIMGQHTTRQGQKLSAATTKRGQNISSATARRGQDISAETRATDRAARQSTSALDRASRESIAAQGIAQKDRANAQKLATANTKIVAVVDTIADILRTQQRGKGGAHGGTGYLYDPNTKKWIPARQALINRGATSAQINAGLAHARGQRLTPQQRAAIGMVG